MGEPPRAQAAAPDHAAAVRTARAEGRPGRSAGVMTALAGTRAFQLAALLVAAVTLVGGLVVWLILDRTSESIARQVRETVMAEAEGIAGILAAAGPIAAREEVARRAQAATASGREEQRGRLYLLETSSGIRLAGNLAAWPPEISRIDRADGSPPAGSGGVFHYAPRADPAARALAAGYVRVLDGDMRLLVGRDLGPQRALTAQVRWLYLAGFGTLALAGLLAGLAMSRHALGRVGEIAATSDQITTGDLSRRVPVTGSGDELDRLAGNLNAMLDRIESLMAGLREVSDNIAHDLKTPLTRLRARAEAALRDGGVDRSRAGLAEVIEDADDLIKTFNALLLIARLEAGALEGTAEVFDLSALVRDVAEFYEPVAEEVALRLVCRADGEVAVRANRQLVGQAMANLIDNAIKYGRPPAAGAPAEVTVDLAKSGELALVTVGDRGPGIPAADRDRVLKRFVRLEASRTRPGTGLGLSLVAAVARLHGGSIGLSDNGPGLRIELRLPRAADNPGQQ